MDDTRQRLIGELAKVVAKKRDHVEARRRLVRRAQDQLDSMPKAIATVEEHVKADRGGGILAQRRLRTLLVERGKLIRYLAEHEHLLDGPK